MTMFGNLTHLLPQAKSTPGPPKDVPPPTPINFPVCYPQDRSDDPLAPDAGPSPKHLTSVLQGIIRPNEITIAHLEALGAHVIPDSTPADLIPDPTFIPDFDAWEALSADEVHTRNESTRRRMNTGSLSPGCQTYLERQRELSIQNEAAYRAVRRIPAPKGQSQARLGNSFEFFRHLELLATYWDDTSKPVPLSNKPDKTTNEDGKEVTGAEAETKETEDDGNDISFGRTGTGHQMPPEYRQSVVTAFLKMVAYDFGCNASAPRTEPRLYITANLPPAGSSNVPPRSFYFPSGCTFVFRTPTTREAARAGIVEGPLAALSARHTVAFPPHRPAPLTPGSTDAVDQPSPTSGTDRDSTLDLARELVAALITAQHRAREGKEEKRIGDGAWWTTKPRWGGGSGGPIGREVEMQSGADVTIGDKDEPPPLTSVATPAVPVKEAATPSPSEAVRKAFSRPSYLMSSSGGGGNGNGSSSSGKSAKRLKKSGNLPMYDNYRMIRPPSSAWDKKTKYAAVGRAKGVDYDDVYVVSALFHHISVLRVRVPDRLLAVLEGQADDEVIQKGRKSWGRLEVRRSPWYDLFKVEDRLVAMRLVWGIMSYLMRAEEKEEDVKMEDA